MHFDSAEAANGRCALCHYGYTPTRLDHDSTNDQVVRDPFTSRICGAGLDEVLGLKRRIKTQRDLDQAVVYHHPLVVSPISP